jgi:hypothetical protein
VQVVAPAPRRARGAPATWQLCECAKGLGLVMNSCRYGSAGLQHACLQIKGLRSSCNSSAHEPVKCKTGLKEKNYVGSEALPKSNKG